MGISGSVHSKKAIGVLGLLIAVVIPCEAQTAGKIDFERDVRPILNEHCVKCHGPVKKKGQLRLDRKRHALAGGESGKPILSPILGDNELYRRITTDDKDHRMPQEASPLETGQVQVIRDWIEEGAVWPDEEAADLQPWWQRWVDEYEWYFDHYVKGIRWLLLAILLGMFGVERCKGMRRRGRGGGGRSPGRWVFRVSRVPRSFYLVALLGAFLYQSLTANAALRQEMARLVGRTQGLGGGITVEMIYGSPPVPFRPNQPRRLGGEYYRGNCERSDQLFNRGAYRTATFYLSLHDMKGKKLKVDSGVPADGLQVRLDIERAPNATESLFSPSMMSSVFMSTQLYPPSPVPALDEPVWLTVVKPGQRWGAYFPIPDSAGRRDGSLSGLIYVYRGSKDMHGQVGGEYHYGIKYDLNIQEGKIAEDSDLWLGNIYWNNSVALPADPRKVPFEQWFSADPIPVITGENTKDPVLLGVEEHKKYLEKKK